MTPCGPSPPAIRPATAVPWKSATAPWPAWLGACSTSSGPVSTTPLSTTATVTFLTGLRVLGVEEGVRLVDVEETQGLARLG